MAGGAIGARSEVASALARNTALFRGRMGYSQERLADEAGVPRKTIYNTEKHGNAGTRTIEKLAAVFGVSVATMLELDEATAEAVFLARQVDRLSEDARQTFFRAVGKEAADQSRSMQRARSESSAEPIARSRTPAPARSGVLAPRLPRKEGVPEAAREREPGPGLAAPDEADKQFASEQVPALFRLPTSEWHKRLEEEPRFMSIASAREMLAEADRTKEDRPREAIGYFRLAIFVAEEVAKTLPTPPHEFRVTVLTHLAWTLRHVGDYIEAEAALDIAEDAANLCAERESMLARVKLTRAIVLTAWQRWDEALPLVRESRATFAEVNDPARYEMALEQEAVILLSRGDPVGALPILKRVASVAADDQTKARRYLNLAFAFEQSGALTPARNYLKKASALHSKLGWKHALLRSTWMHGKIIAKTGDIDGSLKTLARASEGFRELEDADSAVCVDLDRCEIEIANDRQDTATFDRLRAVATYAIEKRLPESQCRALLFLQRLGRTTKPIHIRYVRDFIMDLEKHPHREFVPPELAA